MKVAITNNIQIWIGLKNSSTGVEHSLEELEKLVQAFCNILGACFSITPTRFVYTKGNENGAVIGLINYPRFTSTPSEMFAKAEALATILMKAMDQCRVSIVTDSTTYMLTNTDLVKEES